MLSRGGEGPLNGQISAAAAAAVSRTVDHMNAQTVSREVAPVSAAPSTPTSSMLKRELIRRRCCRSKVHVSQEPRETACDREKGSCWILWMLEQRARVPVSVISLPSIVQIRCLWRPSDVNVRTGDRTPSKQSSH